MVSAASNHGCGFGQRVGHGAFRWAHVVDASTRGAHRSDMESDHGYYDHYPRRVLERPLAVVGFMGCGVARVAHALASHQGLPFQDLERIVEHAAGMGRTQLVLEQGADVRRRIEREQLQRVIRQRLAPVIALGDGALLDGDSLLLTRTQCTLVHVRRPLEVALHGVLRELSASAASYPEFALTPPSTPADLEDLYVLRLPGYRAAELTIDAGTEAPSRVASRIAEQLGWS